MVCDCCEDFSCPCDLPDFDDIKQYLQEWRDDYTVMSIEVLSRIHACCVSQRMAYVMTCFIGLFEITVFILMSLQLADLVNTEPNFNFSTTGIQTINWDDSCTNDGYSINSLDDAKYYSSVLLPVHATLLGIGCLFCCFLCKPPYGPIVGAVLRYPLSITMIAYTWLLYNIFEYLSNNDCILSSTPPPLQDTWQDRFYDISDWCYLQCIYSTLIFCFMFPTFALLYNILYYSVKYIKIPTLYAFERYYIPCVTRNCHRINCLFVILTCCLPRNERNVLRGNHRSTVHGNKNNMTPEQRKKLVKRETGDCPICGDENTSLLLTRGCEHGCCLTCLSQYLKVDLKDVSKYPRKCFYPECNTLVQYTSVEYALEVEDLAEYDRMLIMSTVNNTETISCSSCLAVMVKPKNNNRALMQCVNPKCKQDLCSQCDCEWHVNITCEEYQSKMADAHKDLDEAFADLIKQEKWGRCPKCGIVVQKIEGCNHMTHHGCNLAEKDNRTDFCYCCGEPLKKDPNEGWKYSANNGEKHFLNGVFEPCVNANKLNNDDNNNNQNNGNNEHGLFL